MDWFGIALHVIVVGFLVLNITVVKDAMVYYS